MSFTTIAVDTQSHCGIMRVIEIDSADTQDFVGDFIRTGKYDFSDELLKDRIFEAEKSENEGIEVLYEDFRQKNGYITQIAELSWSDMHDPFVYGTMMFISYQHSSDPSDFEVISEAGRLIQSVSE